MPWLRPRKSAPRYSRGMHRAGVVTLELIVALPVIVILILAVVEFAIIYQVNLEVAHAARFGAKLAAEITRSRLAATNLGNYDQAATLNDLKERIDEYLANHGLTPSCEVILQHNACVPLPSQFNPDPIPGNCQCSAPGVVLPAGEPPAGEAYVRITVGERLTGNVPNLLATFGLALGDLTLQQSTVFRVETNNTAPTTGLAGTLSGSLPTNYSPISGSFPLSCGSSIAIANPLNTVVGAGDVAINFTAATSSDAEQPNSGLSFSWTVTGAGFNPSAVPNAGAGSVFNTTLTRPTDPNTNGNSTETDRVNTYTITLTVTDGCGASSSCSTTVELRTRDSDT